MDFAIFAIAFNIGKPHLKEAGNKEILAFLEKFGQNNGVILLFYEIRDKV